MYAAANRQFNQTTFSDALFAGGLRVNTVDNYRTKVFTLRKVIIDLLFACWVILHVFCYFLIFSNFMFPKKL